MAPPDAFFLPLQRGRRFCIRHAPEATAMRRGAILYVHPFAEEMNKSRRTAAIQSRALAEAGWAVLQMDLFGCGDSEGAFGEADWRQWHADVADAAAWLREQTGQAPSLWGLRAGCLLACQVAEHMEPAPNLLLWQPPISGKQLLQQFLRMKVTSQILGETSSDRIGTQQLREQLTRGEAVEIAGYTLAPGLALGLEAAELAPPKARARVAWLEVGASAPAELTPAARSRVQAWQTAGHQVDAKALNGAAFWQTQEIAECPELVEATLAAVAEWRA